MEKNEDCSAAKARKAKWEKLDGDVGLLNVFHTQLYTTIKTGTPRLYKVSQTEGHPKWLCLFNSRHCICFVQVVRYQTLDVFGGAVTSLPSSPFSDRGTFPSSCASDAGTFSALWPTIPMLRRKRRATSRPRESSN